MDGSTEVEEMAVAIRASTLLRDLIVASLSLLLYDYLVTFPDEVKFIWPSAWNLAKVLFFATRYIPIVDTSLAVLYLIHPSFKPSICDRMYLMLSCMFTFGLFIAEAIISLRTFAIWKGTRWIGTLLVVMNIALAVSAVCLLALTLKNNRFAQFPPPLSEFVPCDDISPRQGIVALMVLLTVQEFVIATLTLWKATSEWRGGMGNPIRWAIIRDAMLFFLVLLVMSTINVVFYSAPSLVSGMRFQVKYSPSVRIGYGTLQANIYELLLTLQSVLHSIVAGRVILHLHIAAKESRGYISDGFHIYDAHKVSSNGSTTGSGDVIVLGRLDISSNDV